MYNQFKETRNLFREFTQYSQPLTFEEWNSKPQDQKAALLFVQFYDQITLAWKNVNRGFNEQVQCDAVEEAIQYLIKNVPIIESTPSKFTPAYIYRVVFNCLDCITWPEYWRGRVYNSEQSNIINEDGEELDLFDLVAAKDVDMLDLVLNTDEGKEKLWKLIEDMGQETVLVVAKLLGDPTNPLKKNKSGFGTFGEKKLSQVTEEVEARVVAALREQVLALGLA